jgi:hypothetical protein
MKNLALGLLLLLVAGCAAIAPTPVQPFPYHDQWILLDDLQYNMGSSNVSLIVPTGFVTDYASIPRGFWGIASPQDVYSEPAVVHDYLYWTQSCTRAQADNIFYIAMQEASVNPIRRWFIYHTVRAAGQSSWDQNQKQFKEGLPRFVPRGAYKLSAEDRWPAFRKALSDKGIHDPEVSKNLPYCAIGNSTDIPTGFHKEKSNNDEEVRYRYATEEPF